MIAIRPPILLYVARAACQNRAALARKRSMPRTARMSLLDGKIEAAAGTVVGAQDQHHIFVADRAAQRFLVVYQRHGMNSVQPLDQTLRVILALIQSHKANHAPLHPETAVDVIRAVKNVLPTTSVLILGGSVPPGFPDDFYYELGKSAQEYDVPFILDASGPLLLNGMEASPVLIKPNEEEYYATFGVHPSVTQEFCASYRQILMEHNIAYGAVSLGEKGALLVTPEAAWYSEPVSVDVKGVQGAGDSMVSGFAYAIAKQHTQGDQLLKMAVSCAHASLELPGTQMCTMAGVEKRFPLTPVKRLCTF